MNKTDTSVGDRIREIRVSRKMNQRDLARRTGLTQSWISRYERGEQKPGPTKLALLAKALNVPVSSFFTDTAKLTGIEQYLIEHLRDDEKINLQIILDQPKSRERLYQMLELLSANRPIVSDLVDNLIALTSAETKQH